MFQKFEIITYLHISEQINKNYCWLEKYARPYAEDVDKKK